MIVKYFMKNGVSETFLKLALFLVLQVLIPFVLYISGDGFSGGAELYRMREIFEYIICALVLAISFFFIIRFEEKRSR